MVIKKLIDLHLDLFWNAFALWVWLIDALDFFSLSCKDLKYFFADQGEGIVGRVRW